MYYVYILQSKKDKKHYIGCTSNLAKRILAHNSGKTQSLKHRRPLEVVYFEQYNDVTEAYKREREIKSYKGGILFKKLLKQGGFA